jgi:hypothetical protein
MHRKATPFPPPKPIQLPVQPVPRDPVIGAPPEVDVPDAPKPEPHELPRLPKVPPQPVRVQRPAPGPPVVVGPPAPAQVEPPAPVPVLGPMLSEAEKQAYHRSIDQLLARTRGNIATARRRSLGARERDMLSRAESFAGQARELREMDPAGAKSLAERAELMSREAAGR